jgi:hypothetical protein
MFLPFIRLLVTGGILLTTLSYALLRRGWGVVAVDNLDTSTTFVSSKRAWIDSVYKLVCDLSF